MSLFIPRLEHARSRSQSAASFPFVTADRVIDWLKRRFFGYTIHARNAVYLVRKEIMVQYKNNNNEKFRWVERTKKMPV